MTPKLHPAENRGLREVYLTTRQLVDHWRALAARRPESSLGKLLARGADTARELLDELEPATAAHGLHGRPAAQGAGRAMARQRGSVRDRFLEVNQAARFAVEDIQHVVTLLGYLAEVSAVSGNDDLAELAGRWDRKLRRLESQVRRAVIELGKDPDASIEPLDSSPLGRAAHGLGGVAGSFGEWMDAKAARSDKV